VIGREAIGEVFQEVEQRSAAVLVLFRRLLGIGPGGLPILRHAVRQVAIDATRTIVGSMHAGAGDRLIHVHQIFAFAEGIQRHGHGTDVEGVTADPQQMIEDTGDFVEHHPDVLATLRHLNAQQLLGGQAVGMLVAHHRDVVETVHVRHRLDPGPRFRQFFGGPVQQADVWVGALHDFAVQFQHQTQHAVRGRVLRAEVQGEIADISHVPDPRRCLRARCAGCFREARWSPAGRSRVLDPGHSASRHDPKSGSPCGRDDR
jgi:hypothetical protein